jgi:hypothetical protein
MGAVHPLQIWMHPLGICKIEKKNMLISMLKTRDTGPHPRAASVETPRLEITDFQKMDIRGSCKIFCAML